MVDVFLKEEIFHSINKENKQRFINNNTLNKEILWNTYMWEYP